MSLTQSWLTVTAAFLTLITTGLGALYLHHIRISINSNFTELLRLSRKEATDEERANPTPNPADNKEPITKT